MNWAIPPGELPLEADPRLVFSGVAQSYDRVRPSYPDAAVDDIVSFAGVCPGDRALEVGSGTGKATILFAARGLDLVCLEPNQEMAEVTRRNCADFPQVSVETCAFEDWAGPPGSFRLVLSAQSWHWMPPLHRYTLAWRVLDPGGTVAVIWNQTTWPDPALRRRLRAAYRFWTPTLCLGGPDPGRWAAEIAGSGLFDSVRTQTYRSKVVYSCAAYLELLSTYSDHRMLPEADLRRLLDAVAEAVGGGDGLVDVEYLTRVHLAQRLG